MSERTEDQIFAEDCLVQYRLRPRTISWLKTIESGQRATYNTLTHEVVSNAERDDLKAKLADAEAELKALREPYRLRDQPKEPQQ